MERGEPMITSMKMKAFDAESVTSEMLPGGADTADPAPADSPDSSDKPRFSGRFHRRSIRRGSKYKMTHRSPTELSKVKKIRRAKANDRERTRMQTLNQALEKLRVVLPAFPDETKLTKIETLRYANNYIKTLTEMIKSMDTGSAPNLPVTGWEGLLGGAGGGDLQQQCAIIAHSLMSQQYGAARGEAGDPDLASWELPAGPAMVTSPVRGQQHPCHYPPPHYPAPAPAPGYHHGQLSPGPEHMSPVKLPPSPGHPLSPDQYHVTSTTCHVSSPGHKNKTQDTGAFIDNNPGYYRGPAPAPAQQWAPELAIQPSVPSYDELSHPPIASSLYGQDLRYNHYY